MIFFGTELYKYPEILLKSYHDINSSNKKIKIKSKIISKLISSYIRLFGIPDVSFQLRAKYFYDQIISNKKYIPKKILDAGSGIGYYSLLMSKSFPNSSILGVDTDTNKLKFTKSLGIPKVKFEYHNLNNVILNKKFDLIVNIDVLEHIKDYKKVLKNFYSMLEPGGNLYIHTPQVKQKRFFKSFFKNWQHDDHVREGYIPEHLLTELKRIGFVSLVKSNGLGPLSSLVWEINQILLSFNLYVSAVIFPLLLLITYLEKRPTTGLTFYLVAQKKT
jgi:2-polyprenyl-3-methyl-5-hydroxy-6-metoxy-1,4-benzoquinol methylase